MLNESALYVYIFWVDNVFSSLVASALCEVFPQYSFSRNFSLSGLAEMLAYDFLVVTSTFFLCWSAIRAFHAAQLRQQAADRPARRRAAVRDLFSKLLAYASSFTMATVHKMAVTFGWLGLQRSLNGRADVIGSFGSGTGQCKGKSTTMVISVSLVYAIAICAFLLTLSIILIEVADVQKSRMRQFLLRMLSESYSIAVGWSVFNVSETLFKCGLPMLYRSGEGEVFRGLLTSVMGFALYARLVYERRDSSNSLLTWADTRRSDRGHFDATGRLGAEEGNSRARWLRHLVYFGDKAIHVTVALTVVDTYLIPIQRTLGSTPMAFVWLSIMAIAVSVVASLLTIYSSAAVRDTPYYNFFIKSAGWIAAYSWWYAFDVVLKGLYGHSYMVRAFLTAGIGVLVTAVTAAIATLLLNLVFDDLGSDNIGGGLCEKEEASSETTGLIAKENNSVSRSDGTMILLNQSSLFAFVPPDNEGAESDVGEEERNSIVI
jgi:hypothetical protein